MFKKIVGILLPLSIATAGNASTPGNISVRSCGDAGIRIEQLAVRADGQGMRSFYDGGVLVMLVDQIEPAAAAYGLAILLPDKQSEVGDRKCLAVTNFSYLDLDKAKSSYDPAVGVTLVVPAMDYDGMGSVPGKPLRLVINADSGLVTARR